jgi:hypothetical protein
MAEVVATASLGENLEAAESGSKSLIMDTGLNVARFGSSGRDRIGVVRRRGGG